MVSLGNTRCPEKGTLVCQARYFLLYPISGIFAALQQNISAAHARSLRQVKSILQSQLVSELDLRVCPQYADFFL